MFKIYADVLEDSALDQFMSAMDKDFTVKGALMPDAHTGYDLPIGAVVATDGVVVPSWVGYDIGCGMSAIRLDLSKDYVKHFARRIYDSLNSAIPVGFNRHDSPQDWDGSSPLTDISSTLFNDAALMQLGTLGGGNHFLEIGYDDNDDTWMIVHSGSRRFGHSIATHYMGLGDYLDSDSDDGKAYALDLDFGLEYALANRELIINKALDAIGAIGDRDTFINRNHNHAELKDGLWIHRKGATHAELGMMGVIPGNMRDGSFIVRGLGNPDSLCSSSHGAGRVLGRRRAKRDLNVDDFHDTMTGIVANVDASTLDESPFAYKNIFDVMKAQDDLVETVAWVRPLVNVKG